MRFCGNFFQSAWRDITNLCFCVQPNNELHVWCRFHCDLLLVVILENTFSVACYWIEQWDACIIQLFERGIIAHDSAYREKSGHNKPVQQHQIQQTNEWTNQRKNMCGKIVHSIKLLPSAKVTSEKYFRFISFPFSTPIAFIETFFPFGFDVVYCLLSAHFSSLFLLF